MDETIKILREQTVLCAHLPTLFDELINVMKNNSPEVQEPVRKIEAVMRDLNKTEQRAQEFLKRVNAPNFAEYLAKQEKGIPRSVAEKLLKKLGESQQRLQNQLSELKLLLQRGKDYVEFNLNILARISASETYGATAQRDSQRTRRMFEARI